LGREEALRLIALGYSNKEVAGRLSVSVKTVEAHKANGMRKLGLGARSDIVGYAIFRAGCGTTRARRRLFTELGARS
jgi:DNA-binding CsgD family transcriptional regulator